MNEREFIEVLAKSKTDISRMYIIQENFKWPGIVTETESAVAIHYIAKALITILGKIYD